MLLPSGDLLTPSNTRWLIPMDSTNTNEVRFPRTCCLECIARYDLVFRTSCAFVVEYTSPSNDSRRPLWNALRYASSFAPHFPVRAQRLMVSDLVA
ncbi:hypothetical protein BJV78DRAFT_1266177 [Lactifluus subvellereus]|nr:hypothetical protein BJV78DRAFT_1266177 [Lactifluus subvellereus]